MREESETMETVEYFDAFLRKTGVPNLLAIGIIIVVIWLLISGFVKGIKRERQKKD